MFSKKSGITQGLRLNKNALTPYLLSLASTDDMVSHKRNPAAFQEKHTTENGSPIILISNI